jgi:integrase
MASLVRRGKTYYAKYWVGKKQRWVHLKTKSRPLALEQLHKIEATLIKGEELPLPTKTPLAQVLSAYVAHIHAAKTKNTAKSELFYLRDVFGPICPELDVPSGKGAKKKNMRKPASGCIETGLIEGITTAQIVAFILARMQARNLSPKTCNRYRGILSRLFSWAMTQYGVRMPNDVNPAQKVERYREQAHAIRFLTRDQIEEQLRTLEGHPVIQTLVAIYIFTGVRREEALWLTRKDIDLETGRYGVIHVRAKTVDGEFWQPKTKVNRVVPVSRRLREYLERYQIRIVPGGWYLPSPAGRRWNPDNFSQDLRALNEKRSLPWGCLDFRHTFGSHLAMKGESLYKIATLMGNSPEICRRHYAALLPESLIDSVEFMGESLPLDAPFRPKADLHPLPRSGANDKV